MAMPSTSPSQFDLIQEAAGRCARAGGLDWGCWSAARAKRRRRDRISSEERPALGDYEVKPAGRFPVRRSPIAEALDTAAGARADADHSLAVCDAFFTGMSPQ